MSTAYAEWLKRTPTDDTYPAWRDEGVRRGFLAGEQPAPPRPSIVQPGASAVEIVKLSDVTPVAVRWLWPGRIAYGKVTILDGEPGVGKSTLCIDLAARGSRGGLTPTGEPLGEPFCTVIVTGEDDPADTILPRLLAAGGDPARVYIQPDLALPDQIDALEAILRQTGAKLLVVDPIMAHLDQHVRTNNDQSVRLALKPLQALAARLDVAVVILRHLNKKSGDSAINRGGGSIGFGGLARAVFACGRDPLDRTLFVMAPVKVSVAKEPPSLAYRLTAPDDYGAAHIEWAGESPHDAEALIGADREATRDKSETNKLADAIRETVLENGGDMLARDAYDALRADGFDPEKSQDNITRARRKAGVETYRPDNSGPWHWRIRTRAERS